MCASLMAPQQATTEQLKASIRRKFNKFGSLEAMPVETRKLVKQGLAELARRAPTRKGMRTSDLSSSGIVN